jgi:predicted nucleic acid-binding protein
LESAAASLAAMALRIKGLFVMSGTNLVFDTCAVIKLLDRQHNPPLSGINVDEARLLTSVIVRMELLSKRNLSGDEARDIREFLDDLIIVPLDEAVEQKAVEIRRATSVKLPDCIIAATSVVLDAILLTDDDQLLNLSWPGLRTRAVL